MSIVDIKQGWTGTGSGGDDQIRWFRQVFTLTTDSADDGPLFAYPIADPASGLTIYAPGTYWAPNMAYRSRMPQAVRKGPKFWEISVEWATPRPGALPPSAYEDPLAAPAEVEWGTTPHEVTYTRDILGDPVENSAHEPFEPHLTRSVQDPTIQIVRNQAAFSVADLIAFIDTVNDGTFLGFAGGRGRMLSIRAQTVHASSDYWRVAYAIAFRVRTPTGVSDADAWARLVLNQGLCYLDANGKKQPFADAALHKLDADGHRIADDSSAVVWKYVREFPVVNWAPLGLEA
jgi:hypothetical protein